jgi:hypothetical protein
MWKRLFGRRSSNGTPPKEAAAGTADGNPLLSLSQFKEAVPRQSVRIETPAFVADFLKGKAQMKAARTVLEGLCAYFDSGELWLLDPADRSVYGSSPRFYKALSENSREQKGVDGLEIPALEGKTISLRPIGKTKGELVWERHTKDGVSWLKLNSGSWEPCEQAFDTEILVTPLEAGPDWKSTVENYSQTFFGPETLGVCPVLGSPDYSGVCAMKWVVRDSQVLALCYGEVCTSAHYWDLSPFETGVEFGDSRQLRLTGEKQKVVFAQNEDGTTLLEALRVRTNKGWMLYPFSGRKQIMVQNSVRDRRLETWTGGVPESRLAGLPLRVACQDRKLVWESKVHETDPYGYTEEETQLVLDLDSHTGHFSYTYFSNSGL